MDSEKVTQKAFSKLRINNLKFPSSVSSLDDFTVLETSLGAATRRSKDDPENLCENAPTARHDLKINEFSTKSYYLNSKDILFCPENLLETRETLDLVTEGKENIGDEGSPIIKNREAVNKMNNNNRRVGSLLDSYSKLYMPKNKKTLGSLKPIRDLTFTERSLDLSKLQKPTSHRLNGEPKVFIDSQGSNIRQLRGDFQEPKGLDFEEEDEGKGAIRSEFNNNEVKKEKVVSPNLTPRQEQTGVLKNIQNFKQNSMNFDRVNKPNPTISLKKTKFQENTKDVAAKKHDENIKLSKSNQKKSGDLSAHKNTLMKNSTTPKKPTVMINKLEGIMKSSKKGEPAHLTLSLSSRRDEVRISTSRKNNKDCGEYFENTVIFKKIANFLCINSLTQLIRVCKRFRTSEYLAFVKKQQLKLIITGLDSPEQYEFWNLRLDFTSLQRVHPKQFLDNATKKTKFERDIISDIDRTRPFNDKVAKRQQSLLKILFALSNGLPKIGYVQGLNSIVAVFLSQDLKDFEVYWLMKYILKKKKFDGVLSEGFPMVQLLNYQLEVYVRNYLPDIIHYLEERELNISYFTTQWFIAMFSYELELPQLMKIWNLFLLQGWKIVIRVSLALLWNFKDDILRKSADDLPFYLKNFIRDRSFHISDETLFKIAATFKVNNRLLKTLEILYEHSAPTNVILTFNYNHKPEWKVSSDRFSSQSSAIVYKDVMEYLNEDIDHMKIINQTKGPISNEIDNYRSVQHSGVNNLIVDKQCASMNRNARSSINGLDENKSTDKLNNSQTQTASVSESTFLQTLTELGKKLKKILTPKHNPTVLTRKFSDIKVLQNEQTENENGFKEPLSERLGSKRSSIFDKADSKCESVSSSLNFSSSSRSKDFDTGVLSTEKNFGEPRTFTDNLSGRSPVMNSELTDNSFNTKSFVCPSVIEPKHKRNSSMPYEQFSGATTTLRKVRTTCLDYNSQVKDNNLSLTEQEDPYPILSLKEGKNIKDLRKSSSQAFPPYEKAFYLPTDYLDKIHPLKKNHSNDVRADSISCNISGANHTNRAPNYQNMPRDLKY